MPKELPALIKPMDTAPSVLIYNDVLEELRFNAQWRKDRMGGGLLAGRRYLNPETDQVYLEIEGFLAGTHITDTHEFTQYLRVQWKAATAGLHYHFEGAEILGWYLAIPDDRRPGPPELTLHEAFFDHAWQRGLWVRRSGDPVALRFVEDSFVNERIGIVQGR